MYSFTSDYSEGAHPDILARLASLNSTQQPGYGDDAVTAEAVELIRRLTANPEAEIYFVAGGTQANLTVIAALLRPAEAVICADTGHIAIHEAGAIEATGHRVVTVGSHDGKLTPDAIRSAFEAHSLRPHTVRPAMVYISNATEVGTVYRKAELAAIHDCCRRHNLILYLDGARLATALTAADSDLTLPDLARLTDVFYIGATKNGALFGEAIVFNRPTLCPHFDYVRKQHGALMAKGWVLAAQFAELLADDRYFALARHANRLAAKITAALKAAGYTLLAESTTNQVFPILTTAQIAKLRRHFAFEAWQPIDADRTAIRLCTSWATDEAAVDELIKELEHLACRVD